MESTIPPALAAKKYPELRAKVYSLQDENTQLRKELAEARAKARRQLQEGQEREKSKDAIIEDKDIRIAQLVKRHGAMVAEKDKEIQTLLGLNINRIPPRKIKIPDLKYSSEDKRPRYMQSTAASRGIPPAKEPEVSKKSPGTSFSRISGYLYWTESWTNRVQGIHKKEAEEESAVAWGGEPVGHTSPDQKRSSNPYESQGIKFENNHEPPVDTFPPGWKRSTAIRTECRCEHCLPWDDEDRLYNRHEVFKRRLLNFKDSNAKDMILPAGKQFDFMERAIECARFSLFEKMKTEYPYHALMSYPEGYKTISFSREDLNRCFGFWDNISNANKRLGGCLPPASMSTLIYAISPLRNAIAHRNTNRCGELDRLIESVHELVCALGDDVAAKEISGIRKDIRDLATGMESFIIEYLPLSVLPGAAPWPFEVEIFLEYATGYTFLRPEDWHPAILQAIEAWKASDHRPGTYTEEWQEAISKKAQTLEKERERRDAEPKDGKHIIYMENTDW